jgi:hypothetical protein
MSTEYHCEYCKFKTKNKYSFATHNESAKHKIHVENLEKYKASLSTINNELKNVENCELCKNFSIKEEKLNKIIDEYKMELEHNKEKFNKTKDKLITAEKKLNNIVNDHKIELDALRQKYKSKIKCHKEKYVTDINTQIEKYIEVVEKSKNEIVEQKDKHINDMVTQRNNAIDNMNATMSVCAKITEKSVETVKSAITYANTNFNNAPVLKKISNFECFDDRDIIEELLNNYNDETIYKYIGDIIIGLYKKENAIDQSLWNTDSSRFAYIIRKKTKQDAIWEKDPNTETIEKLIIAPLVEYFIDAINNEKEKINKFIKKNRDQGSKIRKKISIKSEILKILTSVKIFLDDVKLSKNIIKYVTPHFSISSQLALAQK